MRQTDFNDWLDGLPWWGKLLLVLSWPIPAAFGLLILWAPGYLLPDSERLFYAICVVVLGASLGAAIAGWRRPQD